MGTLPAKVRQKVCGFVCSSQSREVCLSQAMREDGVRQNRTENAKTNSHHTTRKRGTSETDRDKRHRLTPSGWTQFLHILDTEDRKARVISTLTTFETIPGWIKFHFVNDYIRKVYWHLPETSIHIKLLLLRQMAGEFLSSISSLHSYDTACDGLNCVQGQACLQYSTTHRVQGMSGFQKKFCVQKALLPHYPSTIEAQLSSPSESCLSWVWAIKQVSSTRAKEQKSLR